MKYTLRCLKKARYGGGICTFSFCKTLRKKCPYLELFWSAFSRIRTDHREILSNSPYSFRVRENAGQNNSKYGHFSRSENYPEGLTCIV